LVHAATSKDTPADDDELGLVDSAASWVLKKLTWTNIKATLKTYLDGLYAVLAHGHTGTTDSPKLAQANTHESADTDSATSALHHTIGATAMTAAAGNHNHTGVYDPAGTGAGAVTTHGTAYGHTLKLKYLAGGVFTDAMPQTPAGHTWRITQVLLTGAATGGTPPTVPAGETWIINESACVEVYAVAGYIDYGSPAGGVLFTDSVGDTVTVTIVGGLVTGPSTGSIYATRTDTGDTVALAIQGDGTVTGYTGEIQVTDATSGDTVYLRVTSAGHLTQ